MRIILIRLTWARKRMRTNRARLCEETAAESWEGAKQGQGDQTICCRTRPADGHALQFESASIIGGADEKVVQSTEDRKRCTEVSIPVYQVSSGGHDLTACLRHTG